MSGPLLAATKHDQIVESREFHQIIPFVGRLAFPPGGADLTPAGRRLDQSDVLSLAESRHGAPRALRALAALLLDRVQHVREETCHAHGGIEWHSLRYHRCRIGYHARAFDMPRKG